MKDLVTAFRSLRLLIKKYPWIILTQAIDIIAGVAVTVIPIRIVSDIAGVYETGGKFSNILPDVFLYLFILFAIGIIVLINNFAQNYINRNFKVEVATMLYRKLDSVDYEFHENPQFLNNYTRALEYGPEYIYASAIYQLTLIKVIAQSLSVFVVIFSIHYLTVVYAVATGVVYFFIKHRVSKINFRFRGEIQPLYRKNYYYNRVFFLKDSAADLKMTNVGDLMIENHRSLGREQVAVYKKYAARSSFLDFLGALAIDLIYPIVLGIVVYFTLSSITLSSFLGLTVAATKLSNLISVFVNHLASLESHVIEAAVSFEVLAMTSRIEGRGGLPVLEVRDIVVENATFGYDEGADILRGVSLEIKKGEKIAIVGANGSGKTTLVKLLLRLYDVKGGAIKINGDNYLEVDTTSLRQKIGAVFQNPEVYSLTVGENVLLRKAETEEDRDLVIEALKFSGLYDDVKNLEEGIDTLVTREFHRKGQIFSGGQIQKLAIARGYAQNYEVLILDEPSSSLDPLAETALYENMLKLGRNRTLVFISHRLSSTVNCDRIYLLSDGKIAEAGSHEELMANNGLYRRMFEAQTEKYLGDEDV